MRSDSFATRRLIAAGALLFTLFCNPAHAACPLDPSEAQLAATDAEMDFGLPDAAGFGYVFRSQMGGINLGDGPCKPGPLDVSVGVVSGFDLFYDDPEKWAQGKLLMLDQAPDAEPVREGNIQAGKRKATQFFVEADQPEGKIFLGAVAVYLDSGAKIFVSARGPRARMDDVAAKMIRLAATVTEPRTSRAGQMDKLKGALNGFVSRSVPDSKITEAVDLCIAQSETAEAIAAKALSLGWGDEKEEKSGGKVVKTFNATPGNGYFLTLLVEKDTAGSPGFNCAIIGGEGLRLRIEAALKAKGIAGDGPTAYRFGDPKGMVAVDPRTAKAAPDLRSLVAYGASKVDDNRMYGFTPVWK